MAISSSVPVIFCAVALGIGIIRQFCVYRWGSCKCKRSMKGKTVIITGANSGIGKATAKELAYREARVILACRDVSRAQLAVKEIRKSTCKGELIIKQLDLSSLESVRSFVRDILDTEKRIDVLINNAGVFHCPMQTTHDGFEVHMGINHLGHFLLTTLLMDKLKDCTPSRIIIVTSSHYRRAKLDLNNLGKVNQADVKFDAYSNSKLANTIFAVELSRQLKGTGVSVYAVSPGFVWTKLGRHVKIPWYKMVLMLPLALVFVRTPYQGCQTVVHCAVSNNVGESGKYYRNCKEEQLSQCATDEKIGKKLWDVSEQLTAIEESK